MTASRCVNDATALHLCKVRAQVAVGQLGTVEAAQRGAVSQRYLEEARVLRKCIVQCSPCCDTEPAADDALLIEFVPVH